MAWPWLRNRRSPGPPSNGGAAAPDGTPSHAATPDRAERPMWHAHQGWPASNPTVTPSPGEASAASPEAAAAPRHAPFWGRGPVDAPAGLDDPGDGRQEDGPADDAVSDVDPRPRRSWEPVVTVAGDGREQPKAEGIGQHLGSLAHLSANPRARAWQRRGILPGIARGGLRLLLPTLEW